MQNPAKTQPVGLLRRLAAILYDSLLLLAILFVATLPRLAMSEGEAVPASDPLFRLYLIAIGLLYFIWFWTHGGQTLGMRTWHIKVVRSDGGRLTWRMAVLRGVAAVFAWVLAGAGFWSALLREDRSTWHDRLSATELRRVD